ncbi:MAG: S10 family peptidase [Terriglobales bacterium]
MQTRLLAATASLALLGPLAVAQQRRPPSSPPQAKSTASQPPANPQGAEPYPKGDPAMGEPIVTHHTITVNGRALAYTATAGTLPIYVVENHERKLEAHMFFVAYTLDNEGKPNRRPLTFSYNGGPGAASLYVHIGGFGPRRIEMKPDGTQPAPPYRMVDNQQTWLPFTDLVFVDAVGTGYSRAVSPEMLRRASGVEGDYEAFGEFIRMYLSRYDRFTSPLILAGESYGTFRSAGLAGYLFNHGIALNGVMLLSSVLNLQTLNYAPGNDLPYVLYLPTLTAAAWYHHKLPADLQRLPLTEAVAQSAAWAIPGYQEALDQGDQLTGEARQRALAQLSRFTGLSEKYLDGRNLRVNTGEFMAELLRDQGEIVGRYDSRMVGYNRTPGDPLPDYDPSDAAVGPPFTETFLNYVRTELGYKSDINYYSLGGGIDRWDWQANGFGGGYADASTLLESAMAKNQYMKLFVAEGYYDLATPFFEAQYSIKHLFLPPPVRGNVSEGHYEVGHMIYLKDSARIKLARDAEQFITTAAKTE